ncbi:MAG: MBL fold metallo-hydrolase [Thermoleophilaceae bacterium]
MDDEPLTLVDTGPNSGTSLDRLAREFDALGRRIADLGLIIVSHQHMYHLGLVDVIVQRSGAGVAALDALAPLAADWEAGMTAEDAYADAVMTRYGIPPDVRRALRAMTASFRGWGASMTVTQPLHDGSSLTLRDRRLTAHHRPGHSPSDIVLHDAASGALLTGDHLLPDIASSPPVSRPLAGVADVAHRPSALLTYMVSLPKTGVLDLAVLLPGHGAPFSDHRALIDDRLAMWRRRAGRVRDLLSQGPRTAYDLAQATWSNVPVTRAYLALSSILGQTDLLIADGLVRESSATTAWRRSR